jgi:hypothetical protein
MPTVLLPAAAPLHDATVAAPPAATTSPEYVYLFRVATHAPTAKTPTVLLPAAEPLAKPFIKALPVATTQPE